MATRRGHAAGIPTRTNNMKLLTITLAAAMVMAATGCETTQQKAEKMQAKGYVRTPAGDWVPKGTPFFGDGVNWATPETSFGYDPTVFNQAMAPAPPPAVIVAPSGSGVTTAGRVGGTTMISTFGGGPVYTPPAYGYYGY
jgi:hypothetical protein